MMLQFRHRLRHLAKALTLCEGLPQPNSELSVYVEYRLATTRCDRKRTALRLMSFPTLISKE
jgi:hypothetical protein